VRGDRLHQRLNRLAGAEPEKTAHLAVGVVSHWRQHDQLRFRRHGHRAGAGALRDRLDDELRAGAGVVDPGGQARRHAWQVDGGPLPLERRSVQEIDRQGGVQRIAAFQEMQDAAGQGGLPADGQGVALTKEHAHLEIAGDALMIIALNRQRDVRADGRAVRVHRAVVDEVPADGADAMEHRTLADDRRGQGPASEHQGSTLETRVAPIVVVRVAYGGEAPAQHQAAAGEGPVVRAVGAATIGDPAADGAALQHHQRV
jgi:hypothetical protein